MHCNANRILLAATLLALFFSGCDGGNNSIVNVTQLEAPAKGLEGPSKGGRTRGGSKSGPNGGVDTPLDDPGWYSEIYPKDWQPLDRGGKATSDGRFLHDFSYAGYHNGNRPIPDSPPGAVYDVVKDYGADATGKADATTAIQSAIDAAAQNGGGVVYLPAGTFKLVIPSGKNEALRISSSRVVLRGAGKDRSFLFNDPADNPQTAGTALIHVEPPPVSPTIRASWEVGREGSKSTTITGPLMTPTTRIPVANASLFAVGDWVGLGFDTDFASWRQANQATHWTDNPRVRMLRQVTAIEGNVVVVNVPTRIAIWEHSSGDANKGPRLWKLGTPPLEEVGLERFAIGQLPHPELKWEDGMPVGATEPSNAMWWRWLHAADFTAVHERVDGGMLIRIGYTVANSWVRDVQSYDPRDGSFNPTTAAFAANGKYLPTRDQAEFHMVSHGLAIEWATQITVQNVRMAYPQFQGGGGNGYGFKIMGSETLVTQCEAINNRHNFSHQGIQATGNVLHLVYAQGGWYDSVDFHQTLSTANLIDAAELKLGDIAANPRAEQSPVGQHNVIWNATINDSPEARPNACSTPVGSACVGSSQACKCVGVQSFQLGWGYVIGTSGNTPDVENGPAIYGADPGPAGLDSSPVDWVEGAGRGQTLAPQSLYEDQLAHRRAGDAKDYLNP